VVVVQHQVDVAHLQEEPEVEEMDQELLAQQLQEQQILAVEVALLKQEAQVQVDQVLQYLDYQVLEHLQ
tara:strand:+ start:542 stop:748 length:207 start_codon:yes stop_codon:yes gene_type:complete